MLEFELSLVASIHVLDSELREVHTLETLPTLPADLRSNLGRSCLQSLGGTRAELLANMLLCLAEDMAKQLTTKSC